MKKYLVLTFFSVFFVGSITTNAFPAVETYIGMSQDDYLTYINGGLEAEFRASDKDKNGIIARREANVFLVRRMFLPNDKKKKGLKLFFDMALDEYIEMHQEGIKKAFITVDTNADGILSEEELKAKHGTTAGYYIIRW